MAKYCEICGKYSGWYPLCKECSKLIETGEIEKCENCGVWHYVNEPCDCEEEIDVAVERQPQKDCKCIICSDNAPNGPFCRECYYEMLDIKDSFDKNQKSFQLNDYYFNLRNNIYRMKTFDYVQSNCIKLMSLAVLSKELYENTSLTDRVVEDIKEIIKKKKPKEESTLISEETKVQDSRKEEIKRTMDGHYVKSDAECVIDDILYENRIVHCYEKKVPISADEPTIMADWFIPIYNNRKGIYIEYWGMKTKEYLENKERKLESYKRNNIPLISIEKDDYRDRQGLTDRLIQEINDLAKKHFNVSIFLNN